MIDEAVVALLGNGDLFRGGTGDGCIGVFGSGCVFGVGTLSLNFAVDGNSIGDGLFGGTGYFEGIKDAGGKFFD